MAHTKISELGGILAKGRFWMHGQFKNYGEALNYCIKENISIKKIKPVYSPYTGRIDFYSIRGLKLISKGQFIKFI